MMQGGERWGMRGSGRWGMRKGAACAGRGAGGNRSVWGGDVEWGGVDEGKAGGGCRCQRRCRSVRGVRCDAGWMQGCGVWGDGVQ